MLSTIAKYIVPIALTCIATVARADTETFPFTYTTSSGAQITASGSFTTDGFGTQMDGFGPSDVTGWNITFTSPSFLGASFVLNESNSSLSISDGTIVSAFQDPNNLIFETFGGGDGFNLTGTVLFGGDQVKLEWLWYGTAPGSIMWVTNPQGSVNILGSNPLESFPVLFETNGDFGAVPPPAPTPEPSSLLLLGTGSLSIFAAGLRKLNRKQREQQPVS